MVELNSHIINLKFKIQQHYNSITNKKLQMQFVQSYQLTTTHDPNHHIETPTKKHKKSHHEDMKTAESIQLTDQKTHSLNEIDAQQLFERFHDIIKISEVEEEQDDEENQANVYRKLNYDLNPKKAIKLEFSPSNSSMTKKNKISTGKCFANQLLGKQLFEMTPMASPIKRKFALQTEVQSAENEYKIASTPKKLTKSSSHCEMAARKESPYRDLTNKI